MYYFPTESLNKIELRTQGFVNNPRDFGNKNSFTKKVGQIKVFKLS